MSLHTHIYSGPQPYYGYDQVIWKMIFPEPGSLVKKQFVAGESVLSLSLGLWVKIFSLYLQIYVLTGCGTTALMLEDEQMKQEGGKKFSNLKRAKEAK